MRTFYFGAGSRPDLLPGIGEREALARDADVVATITSVYHGIGCGDRQRARA